VASANPNLQPPGATEESFAAFASNGEIAPTGEEAEVADAEAPVGGSATAEWMSLTSHVAFDEVQNEGPPDLAPVALNPAADAQPGAAPGVSESHTEAEPQAG